MTAPAVAVDLPVAWRHRTDAAPFALVARAHPWSGAFAPNLTLALTPFDPTRSLDRYLAGQVEMAAATLADAVLLDAGIDRVERSVMFLIAHATTGVDLTMLQHHRVTDDRWVIAAAATAADDDWPLVAADLIAMVRSTRPAR
ncbi:MAG: hypothetical protein ACRD0A_11340 [Acidimicrobiales bacterium]